MLIVQDLVDLLQGIHLNRLYDFSLRRLSGQVLVDLSSFQGGCLLRLNLVLPLFHIFVSSIQQCSSDAISTAFSPDVVTGRRVTDGCDDTDDSEDADILDVAKCGLQELAASGASREGIEAVMQLCLQVTTSMTKERIMFVCVCVCVLLMFVGFAGCARHISGAAANCLLCSVRSGGGGLADPTKTESYLCSPSAHSYCDKRGR